MITVKQVVERSDTPLGRAFDLTVQSVIVFSLITYSLETLPQLSPTAQHALAYCEVVMVAIFTAEYVTRLIVADRKIGFVTSFYGLVDLLAILPFYLSVGVDLRTVRTLRLLRLFRVLKLTRYSKAIARLHRALLIAREEIVLYLCATVILLFLAAVGIYQFEHEAQPEVFASVFHSLWWAVATLTTVGYGDVYPVTAGGRLFTFFVLMIGLGVVSVPAGLVASALSQARKAEDRKNTPPMWTRGRDISAVTWKTTMLGGQENLEGTPGLTVADFWRWAYSDVVSNRNRSILAEFLVASALGAAAAPRLEWDAVDVRYGDWRIEVKSAAYWQAWKQTRPSTIRFDIGAKIGWDAATNTSAAAPSRAADVYVFWLHAERDAAKADVLDVGQWRFYVVPAAVLDRDFAHQRSLGLAKLEALATPRCYDALGVCVDATLANFA